MGEDFVRRRRFSNTQEQQETTEIVRMAAAAGLYVCTELAEHFQAFFSQCAFAHVHSLSTHTHARALLTETKEHHEEKQKRKNTRQRSRRRDSNEGRFVACAGTKRGRGKISYRTAYICVVHFARSLVCVC